MGELLTKEELKFVFRQFAPVGSNGSFLGVLVPLYGMSTRPVRVRPRCEEERQLLSVKGPIDLYWDGYDLKRVKKVGFDAFEWVEDTTF